MQRLGLKIIFLLIALVGWSNSASAKTLTVIKSGSGSDYGSIVSSSPSGINCGNSTTQTTCSEDLTDGVRTTLTASTTLNSGSFFAGWQVYYKINGTFVPQPDLCLGLDPTCNLTMTYEEAQVRAKFDLGYILTLKREGDGAGSILSTSNNLQNECINTTCQQTYEQRRTVTINAIPTINSTFSGWVVDGIIQVTGSSCPPTSTSCSVTMDKAHSLVARFSKSVSGSYTASVLKQGSGSSFGSVSSNLLDSKQIQCGINAGKCSDSFNSNSNITFTADATSSNKKGLIFAGWQVWYWHPELTEPTWVQEVNMCTGLQPTCDVTMVQEVRVLARFDLDFTLTVVRDGNGVGSIITTSPELNKCTIESTKTICSQTFVGDQEVSLTAVPELKSRFVKWNGCDSMRDDNLDGAQEVCIIKMNQAQIITATFEAIDSAKLSVTKDPSGTGTGTIKSDIQGLNCGTICTRNFTYNTTMTLTAIPDAGSEFIGWGGDWCSGAELTCTLTMNQAKDVTALFQKGFRLTLAKQGSGDGVVTSNPSGISCGSTCAFSYVNNTSVTLTIKPTNGATFLGWGGNCSGTQLTCTLTMTEAKDVTFSLSGVGLSKALDNTMTWITGGDVPWVGQLQKFIFGDSAAVSGVIQHGQNSYIQTTVPGPGKLSFYWQVSSDVADKLSFETTGIKTSISGNVNWEKKTYDLPAGSHTLKWTYAKDADITKGADSGWLDRVEYNGGTILTVAINQEGGYGNVVSTPNGINCDANTCNSNYTTGTVVKLTANAIGGSEFNGWSGACTGNSQTCLVTVKTPLNVTATFTWKNNPTLLTDAALKLGLLNDTGIDWCASNNSNYPADKDNKCASLLSSFANQDAHIGRDYHARKGELPKLGKGDAGFDYSKICNNGEEEGVGNCPKNPALGTTEIDWGCTRDNVSGLIWEVKTDSGVRGKEELYTWYNSNDGSNGGSKGDSCTNSNCNTEKYVVTINQQGLCGAIDWRLPTRQELHTIVHHGQSNPAIDVSFFPNTSPNGYWTATPSASMPFNAWYIDFAAGWDFWDNKTNKQRIRLVRTCDDCKLSSSSSSPTFRNAKLDLPLVNVEGKYYSAALSVVNDNPLTFELVNADTVKKPIGRRTDQAYYYLNGTLVIGGIEVGNDHYNAMLEQRNANGKMRFVLRDAHKIQ